MNNYYDDVKKKIEELKNSEKIDELIKVIDEELKQPYIPRDFEKYLNEVLKGIKIESNYSKSYSDEDIVKLLHGNNDEQLLGVSLLNNYNLRNYIDICNDYLTSEGFINAKVLLVDSLIRQEISEDIKMNNDGIEYEFIPKYLLPIEESEGFIEGIKYLNEIYLKEPSKLKMAKDLLYKEIIMMLPINACKEEGNEISKSVQKYIDNAFK